MKECSKLKQEKKQLEDKVNFSQSNESKLILEVHQLNQRIKTLQLSKQAQNSPEQDEESLLLQLIQLEEQVNDMEK